MSFKVSNFSEHSFDQFLMYVSFDQSMPMVQAQINTDWGANSQNHRQKIKKESAKFPVVSISHCPSLGGFAALTADHPAALQIGFDIEEISRVEEAVAARVAHPKDEIPNSKDVYAPSLMWSAREAAFKSLIGPEQPHVVSQIRLMDWRNPQGNIWTFSFQSSGCEPGRGYAWDDGEFQFAICFWQPTVSV